MIRLITYSADNMTTSRDKCVQSAYKFGAEEVYSFHSKNDVGNDFYETNKAILDTEFCENGTRPCAGYWLQKPYFINRVMNLSNDGDIVCYVDAGVEIIASLQHIVDAMDQDVFLFTNGLQHVHWCKMDTMEAIYPHDVYGRGLTWDRDSAIATLQQVQASAMFFRVNDFTRKFVKEWLLWCQMPGLIDDSPSIIPNHPEFASHRYDQAILCCLQIKYNLHTHWWADARWFESQRYRWPQDRYPSMFIHHRKRNNEWHTV